MTLEPIPVIAIDGPSGVGKGTIALRLAGRLGWHFLDSGALYRVTALAARRAGVALEDEPQVAAIARALPVQFLENTLGETSILLNEDDVSVAIRTESAGNDASRVAALPQVRAALFDRQRAFRQPPGLVADGRDMGTTLFPEAEVKLFLTASAEVRAERRYKQLIEKGLDGSISVLLAEIAARDARDRDRAVSPLVPAGDAVVIDTSELSIEEVMAKAVAVCEAAFGDRLSLKLQHP